MAGRSTKAQGSQPDDEGAAAQRATDPNSPNASAEPTTEVHPIGGEPGDATQARTETQLASNTGNRSGAQAGGREMEVEVQDFAQRAARAREGSEAEEGEYVVLFDHYAWLETNPDTGEQQRYDGLFRQRVYLSAKEAARGLSLGAIARPEDVNSVLARRSMRPSDAQLQAMSAEQLTAYLVQNAEDSKRVYKLEQSRDEPRPEVLEATGDFSDYE